jgi:hypothetical protein
MRYLKILAFGLFGICFLFAAPYAHAQTSWSFGFGIGAPTYGYGPAYVGPPPDCLYGYYDYYPYACAPYGYYGPDWFVGNVFIGAGPWYRSYYRGRGYYGRPDFRGDFDNHNRGFGRGGFRGGEDHGRSFQDRGFRGSGVHNRGAAGGNVRGGNFHSSGGFRGPAGGSFHGSAGQSFRGSRGGNFRSSGGGFRGSAGGGFRGGSASHGGGFHGGSRGGGRR